MHGGRSLARQIVSTATKTACSSSISLAVAEGVSKLPGYEISRPPQPYLRLQSSPISKYYDLNTWVTDMRPLEDTMINLSSY